MEQHQAALDLLRGHIRPVGHEFDTCDVMHYHTIVLIKTALWVHLFNIQFFVKWVVVVTLLMFEHHL